MRSSAATYRLHLEPAACSLLRSAAYPIAQRMNTAVCVRLHILGKLQLQLLCIINPRASLQRGAESPTRLDQGQVRRTKKEGRSSLFLVFKTGRSELPGLAVARSWRGRPSRLRSCSWGREAS